MSANCGCVAQKPWVLVTPLPVFSNVHVTVSPFLRLIDTFRMFGSPVPVLPPEPVTTQSYGVLAFVEPPMPVSTQLS